MEADEHRFKGRPDRAVRPRRIASSPTAVRNLFRIDPSDIFRASREAMRKRNKFRAPTRLNRRSHLERNRFDSIISCKEFSVSRADEDSFTFSQEPSCVARFLAVNNPLLSSTQSKISGMGDVERGRPATRMSAKTHK